MLAKPRPVFVIVLSACLTATVAGAGEIVVDGGRGLVAVHVPAGYDPAFPAPLLLLLHGYSSSGAAIEAALQVAPEADAQGFVYLHPDGSEDFIGNRFWNATDACCDFGGTDIDDASYLRGLIDEVATQLVIDPQRIFVAGHSNGGFMAHRMACDHADRVAAVVSFAGATWDDPGSCAPALPVRVLQIHGTADGVIAYDGGSLFGVPYPGAMTTVATWAAYGGCSPTPAMAPARDLDGGLPGLDSSVTFHPGCPLGAAAELWTIEEGAHSPTPSPTFVTQVFEFLRRPEFTVFTDGFESGDVSSWQ